MADLVWGEPVVGGETVPTDGSGRYAWLYRINDEGTRRSIRYHPNSKLGLPSYPMETRSRRVGWGALRTMC